MTLEQLPIDSETHEDALIDWFMEATGLPCVIWRDQDAPQPEYPYGTLSIISGPTKIGGVDEIRQRVLDPQPDGPAAPALPIELQIVGPREMTVSCQINVGPPNDNDPTENSRSLMAAAQAALGLPSFAAKLKTAGLSVIEELPILQTNVQIADLWVSRSQMDVRFGLTSCVVEKSAVIETVKITASAPFNFNDEEFGGSP